MKTSSRKNILITASSFPLDKKSTKGNFILNFTLHLSTYHNIHVLTHRVQNAIKKESFQSVNVTRFSFLPFSFLHQYFSYGILHAFSSYKLLLIFIAPFYFICQLFALHKIVKKEKIDIIHAHWILPQGLVAILYKKIFNKKIKVISTIHGSDLLKFDNYLGNFLKKIIINRVDHLTVVSNYLVHRVKRITSKDIPVSVLPMGIDTQQFHPKFKSEELRKQLNGGNPILIFVGRLDEKKGIQYLIDAMPNILAKFPTCKLFLLGDGQLRHNLTQKVKELNLGNHIIFIGNIAYSKLPEYYASADIFIGPSLSEGLGLVFAEAAASEIFVISSDYPSISDIIIDGETGFVVRQRNSLDISNCVVDILSNKTFKQKIKENARQHISLNFDWEVIGQKYNNLYKKFIE